MIHEIPAPTRHPILGIQRPPPGKNAVHIMTEEYDREPDHLYTKLVTMSGSPQPPVLKGRRMALRPCLPWRTVQGFQEAEAAIVGLLLEESPRYQYPFEHVFHLNAASSMAANRNRRGMCYHVLINPLDAEDFAARMDHGPGMQVSYDLHRRFGSFVFFGSHPGRDFYLYYSALIPRRTVLLSYRGNNDADVLASYVETIDSTFVSLNNEGVTDPLLYATTLVFAD